MGDEPIYMDDWLRNHGRSVPVAVDGVALEWEHTPQVFTPEELKSMFAEGIVEHRIFTKREKDALDSYISPQWPFQ